jgi:hypothetical protein
MDMNHIEKVIDGHVIRYDSGFQSVIEEKRWSVTKNKNIFYVRSSQLYMHRLIMSASKGQMIDHINGDGLDNRIENLRFTNHQANKANSLDRRSTSKYIGVSTHRRRFQVSAKDNGKNVHIGMFVLEVDAAKAYDSFALKKYGANALLNFPTIQMAE